LLQFKTFDKITLASLEADLLLTAFNIASPFFNALFRSKVRIFPFQNR